MPAYFVVYFNVTNPDQFATYFQVVMPVIERRGGRLIAKGIPEAIEGHLSFKQAAVFEWRSRQDLLEYWHSNEYAEIRALREGAAEFQAVVVEEFDGNELAPKKQSTSTVSPPS